MFVCSAFLKNIFKYFQHVFNTVSSQDTLILQEVFYDYQINLENTANLTAVFEGGGYSTLSGRGEKLIWGDLIIPQKPFNLFMGILRTNDKNQQLLCFQFFLYQKSSISKKASRHFVSRLSLSSLDIFSSSNRNQSSTKVKARMFFIVIPYDLVMSICHCTSPISFLMLTFPILD